jgi:gp32 DNA binding protein like
MDFNKLKKQSGNLDKLAKAIEALNSSEASGGAREDNFWKCEVDKAGNGMATIRFLPAPGQDEDGLPWVKIFSHGFQGPGGWLIDNCLTTLNQQCPVCEHNSTLWNSGIEANKDVVRKQKRRLNYIANIYVVSDPKHPENEGKVFLFKFGKKIFDKITEAMNPQFEDETAINPFDLWSGANFKLKIRKVEGYQNYDKSEFESSSPLSDDDKKLEAIWKNEYSLTELVKESEFKTYDQLKSRLDKVLGLVATPKTTVETIKEEFRNKPSFKKEEDISDDFVDTATVEDDDDLAYFSKFAEED